MNQVWLQTLSALGARFDAGEVSDFGEPDMERDTLSAGTTLHPLSDSVLLVEGEDAAAFLHSQLTSDILALTLARAQYSAYCTAKGRMLATFLVTRTQTGFLLQLPEGLGGPVAQRLRKYMLRARAHVSDATDAWVMLAIGGPAAAQLAAQIVPSPPSEPLEVVSAPQLWLWALEDRCFQLLVGLPRAREVWDRLAHGARPSGSAGWYWRRIKAGIPWVTAATQELFVPQMADLPRIGAVSFTKGCYPGQEIVARAQYRGEVKRRLFRGHVQAAAATGQALYPAAPGSQAAGTVANAAPAPGGGTDLLAVVHVEALASGALQLGAPDGARVTLEPIAPIQAA
jgi:folate-binding protein YgfZ